MCPSAPGGNEMVSWTIPAGTVLGTGFPGTLTEWSMTSGRIDYESANGIRGAYSSAAYAAIPANGRSGLVGWVLAVVDIAPIVAAFGGGDVPQGSRIRDCTDGTSNTILVGELASRNKLYYGRTETDGTEHADTPGEIAAQALTGGGAWGDSFTENWIKGATPSGPSTAGDGGLCGINCSNGRGTGWYSWHTGGAMVALADGSVTFLSENIDTYNYAALITSQGGEVLGEF